MVRLLSAAVVGVALVAASLQPTPAAAQNSAAAAIFGVALGAMIAGAAAQQARPQRVARHKARTRHATRQTTRQASRQATRNQPQAPQHERPVVAGDPYAPQQGIVPAKYR